MSLKICSINVNGFRQGFKRSVIFTRLNQLNFDVIYLQETHVTNKREAVKYSKLWKGKSFWSFGTNHARGVGILFSNQLDITVVSEKFDMDGRLICVDIDMAGCRHRYINVYQPNIPGERVRFIDALDQYLLGTRDIILGGDFNFVENLVLDKHGGNLNRGDTGSASMKRICAEFFLKDAFRGRCPNRKEYSFREGPIHVRLDRFYISDTLMPWVDCVKHIPCTVSDHYYVGLYFKSFDLNKGLYGPGYWKANVSVFTMPAFITEITNLWNNQLSVDPVKDGLWWERCKVKFKKLIISHARQLSSSIRRNIQKLEMALTNFSELARLATDPAESSVYKQYCADISSEINDLLAQKHRGSVIRSRARCLDEGEKSSRYFLRLERAHARSKLITELRVGGAVLTQPAELIEACRTFYSELYTEQPVQEAAIDFFLTDTNLPRLEPHLVESCEGPLSVREAELAISLMKNGKAPGSDGLPSEFYKKFFHLFGTYFVAMINLCYLQGRLTESQRLSLITLLCKDRSFHFLLNYWRPISLMNVDAKIIGKVISLRLRRCMPSIVHIDQSCSVMGRSISDNVHLLRNIFDYVEQKNIACIFLNLDQAKAFDRVSHTYLIRVLEAFGFGPSFIRWITVLYTDISSSVIVNGHISAELSIQRSVRQGCPLSPLLYVLCVEPFSHNIRRNPDIKGLPIPGNEESAKVSSYADDATYILISLLSARILLDTCTIFGDASGAALNLIKSCAMWLGAWKARQDQPFGLTWVTYKKLLGFMFGYGDTVRMNWGPILKRFCNTLRDHSSRNTSMYGRAVIANTMASTKLYYLGSHTNLPSEFAKKLTKNLFAYIWSGQHEAIKRETLYAPQAQGGLNIVSPVVKCQALLIKHIVNFISLDDFDYFPKWAYFTCYWIGFNLRHIRPEYASNLLPHCLEFRPAFYEQAMKLFLKFSRDFPDVNLVGLPVQVIYTKLLSQVLVKPRVEDRYPGADFKIVWKSVSMKFLDPEVRTMAFRIAHEVLPTNSQLFRYGVGQTQNCTFCGQTYVETPLHLFTICRQAAVVWYFVKSMLIKLCNHRLKVDADCILFNRLNDGLVAADAVIIRYLINLAKYSIWFVRCQVKYEHRRIDGAAALKTFQSRLRFRIAVDYYRMTYPDFLSTWIRNETLCSVDLASRRLDFKF